MNPPLIISPHYNSYSLLTQIKTGSHKELDVLVTYAAQSGDLVEKRTNVFNFFHSSCMHLNIAMPITTEEREREREKEREKERERESDRFAILECEIH